MTEKRPNPARDGFRRAMEETDWSRGFFGDGVSLALHAAKSGDMESLAKMLEDGAALDPAERKFAADALRGVARVSRRKLDQRIKELKISILVSQYMRAGMSKEAAKRAIINDPTLPEMWNVTSEETIETYLRNFREGK